MSRTLLKSPKHSHVCSGVYSLRRGFGATSTAVSSVFQRGFKSSLNHYHQSSAIRYGSVPWFRGQLGSLRIPANHKRTLATEAKPGEVNSDGGEMDPEIQLDHSEHTIRIDKPGLAEEIVLDNHWLRNACECSICVDPNSGQKTFSTCDVPTELPIKKASITPEGGIEIVWDHDFLSSGEHVSRYPPKIIHPQFWANPSRYNTPKEIKSVLWDKAIFEQDSLPIDYSEWMAGGSGFISGLAQLRAYGLLFLRNVPLTENSVESIANQVGILQETLYGRTWDVRSKPNAENVAYTSSFLGLHQDLLYLDRMPRIQILHCLENTCEGGESMFSDGHRAWNIIKLGPWRFFDLLARRNIHYQYRKNGHYYHTTRPVLGTKGAVHWSPPFQASYQVSLPMNRAQHSRDYRNWLEAATQFRHLLEDEHWVYQCKMQPGDCVIFDNQRVLHGRRQFDTATGTRWLKGAYISSDVYKSKLRTLAPQIMGLGNNTKLSKPMQA
ncbi:Clavaminate synthase-like protein [Hypoxylon sp. FL0543]|nr:Clavaminate synthase-like protein [Hypoxylon sp. FL0543]